MIFKYSIIIQIERWPTHHIFMETAGEHLRKRALRWRLMLIIAIWLNEYRSHYVRTAKRPSAHEKSKEKVSFYFEFWASSPNQRIAEIWLQRIFIKSVLYTVWWRREKVKTCLKNCDLLFSVCKWFVHHLPIYFPIFIKFVFLLHCCFVSC